MKIFTEGQCLTCTLRIPFTALKVDVGIVFEDVALHQGSSHILPYVS